MVNRQAEGTAVARITFTIDAPEDEVLDMIKSTGIELPANGYRRKQLIRQHLRAMLAEAVMIASRAALPLNVTVTEQATGKQLTG